MNRRTLLKAIAATPLAMAAPAPVQAATPEKPAWLDWEGKAGRTHFMHVRVEPHEVALLPLDERRESAKQLGIAVEALPPEWALQDCTLLGEKFHAALQRVDRPDYSRDILVTPALDGWGERTKYGAWLIRGGEVSTRCVYEWPDPAGGLSAEVVAGALFLEALHLRAAQLRIRNGVQPPWETIRLFSIQFPVCT